MKVLLAAALTAGAFLTLGATAATAATPGAIPPPLISVGGVPETGVGPVDELATRLGPAHCCKPE